MLTQSKVDKERARQSALKQARINEQNETNDSEMMLVLDDSIDSGLG